MITDLKYESKNGSYIGIILVIKFSYFPLENAAYTTLYLGHISHISDLISEVLLYFQVIPTPEKEFAEYIFKTEICLDKSPKDAEKITKEIAKWISALMNTSGGLILLYSNRPASDRKRDY